MKEKKGKVSLKKLNDSIFYKRDTEKYHAQLTRYEMYLSARNLMEVHLKCEISYHENT